jgi:uncharacterized protein
LIVYVDTSAYVKRHVSEPGADIVRTVFEGRDPLVSSRLIEVETASALARRLRERKLSATAHDQLCARVHSDLERMILVEVHERIVTLASKLCREHGLRAYDAVHLASALSTARDLEEPVRVLCADGPLAAACRAEMLEVLVPR